MAVTGNYNRDKPHHRLIAAGLEKQELGFCLVHPKKTTTTQKISGFSSFESPRLILN